MKPLLLDGPMGSCLSAAGLDLPAPLWSAQALIDAPDQVAALHRAYAEAGADVHTANTFRTQPHLHPQWRDLLKQAVRIGRENIPAQARLAGSMAPVEDCYRPDLSPPNSRPIHRAMAQALAESGVDLLLCETFPHPQEALVALEEAVATGLEVWLSLTAGPSGTLLRPTQLVETAQKATNAGASLVAFNCSGPTVSEPFLEALSKLGLPFGLYANAGDAQEGFGWSEDSAPSAEAYASQAQAWLDAGASLIGSCCGTSPAHTAALRARIDA